MMQMFYEHLHHKKHFTRQPNDIDIYINSSKDER
jgi:hypothetical protein